MSDAYLGEIRLVPYISHYPPVGWLFCNGQTISIQTYQPLFSLIGVTYGGDGVSTFGLPNFNGRVLVDQGSGATDPKSTPPGGPALTPRAMGQIGGADSVVLTTANIPSHDHVFSVSTMQNTSPTPSSTAVYGSSTDPTFKHYVTPVPNPAPKLYTYDVDTVTNEGGNVAHGNLMPGLGLRYIICVRDALYPSRG